MCWRKAEETPARHFSEYQAPSTGAFGYLRPGRGQHFVATGRVSRLGDRVAVAHMELVNDNDTDEQIPTGSAAYIAA